MEVYSAAWHIQNLFHSRKLNGMNFPCYPCGHAVLERSKLLNMSKEMEGKRKGVISKFSELSGATNKVNDTKQFLASPEKEQSVAIAAVMQHAMHKTSVTGPKQVDLLILGNMLHTSLQKSLGLLVLDLMLHQ